MVPDHVIEFALKSTRVDRNGLHHIDHWVRVCQYGMLIGTTEGADLKVVAYFAMLHDAARRNDGTDLYHGEHMANLLEMRHGDVIAELDMTQKSLLLHAIASHSDGQTSDDVTVGTCWDADRFDLSRLGVTPSPELMSTDTAKRAAERL